ncbi:uncharacterized protein MJAP1_000582 [Malassezia japonica]|uniref:Prefoldin subunit 1 n=1 Tax=Malassezia japonica TaxID=223818 RepID=A0AAF0J906_9BASI|nr:uncharacterized protein MJAP1_000582 [Malassezia japonica]WFD37635.1 hypothetical protein MJAP1_000582 [Malassezia japonica]
MSEESLPVLLNTVQTRLVQSQRQLSIVRAQVNARQREIKLQELTLEQLKGLGPETRMYEAVGKMFMQESYDDLTSDIQRKQGSASEETDMLLKKQKFLEKQVAEAQSHLNDLVRSIERANVPA